MSEDKGDKDSPLVQRYSADVESFDVGDTKVQHYGLLMKKPFGHKSARWQKRFFIVKEGFLLYYNESESKTFEKSHHFNIHPKGVIPLGGCKVEEAVSGPQKYAIRVTNDNFRGEIWVGADTYDEGVKWAKALRESGKVTWRNAQLGERVIEQLEEKSHQMTQEMETAITQLNDEASALESEKGKKAELEALASKLEEEKKAIEDAAKNLRQEKDTAEQELQQTLESMQHIQVEKETLSKRTEVLEQDLQSVSEEKQKTAAELEERERLAKQLEEEKKQLEEVTTNLKGDLTSLEEQQKLISEEKEATEEMLKTQEQTAKKLEREKKQISDTAINLKANLEQVSQEKQVTETKWKEEKKRRIKTERRLHLAEDSLKRLDRALRDSGVNIDLQIETDVKNLKEFFEDCIKEEQYEAKKLDILRDAVRAKVNYNEGAKKLIPTASSPSPRELSPTPEGDEVNGQTGDTNGHTNGEPLSVNGASESQTVNGSVVEGGETVSQTVTA